MPSLEQIEPKRLVRCFHWTATPDVSVDVLPPTVAGEADRTPLLRVEGLRAEHRSRLTTVLAASEVSFSVDPGRCVALVGESGSGKTTIARVIAGLHPRADGRVLLHGEELAPSLRRRPSAAKRALQLVSQDPANALNPRQTVFESIARPARLLRGISRQDAAAEVSRLLDCVRLPARTAARYPPELSGGERQRVAIARALAADPQIILCDEITSALDVSVQASILKLLDTLRRELGLGLLFITHDLGVVAAIADEVLVLEAGRVREHGTARDVLGAPADPYTQGLLAAAPSISDRPLAANRQPS